MGVAPYCWSVVVLLSYSVLLSNHICLLATLWENSCSCQYETFRIGRQWLWEHAIKFAATWSWAWGEVCYANHYLLLLLLLLCSYCCYSRELGGYICGI